MEVTVPSSVNSLTHFIPHCEKRLLGYAGQSVCLPWSGIPSKVTDECLNKKHAHLSVTDKVLKALHRLKSCLREKNKS